MQTKRRVSVATVPRPSQATTVAASPKAEARRDRRLTVSVQLREHPVSCTDAADEALLLRAALAVCELQDHERLPERLIQEAFEGGLVQVASRPVEDVLKMLKNRLCKLREVLVRENVNLSTVPVEQLGEFCFFILQSLAGVGSDYKAVCMHMARRAITASWWSLVRSELALMVPLSLRSFRTFRRLRPKTSDEPALGYQTNWWSQEFYLDEQMERNFLYEHARSSSEYPYTQCILILIFLGLFISIHYVSTEIAHRALTPARLIVADPVLMLAIGSILRLTLQIVVFNPEDGNFEFYHTTSFLLGLVFGIAATVWLFLADRVFYFYDWLPPEGWGLVSILVLCGLVFTTRFIHSIVVCISVLACALAFRFIFLHKEEYTPIGQIIFSALVAVGVAFVAYIQEAKAREDFKLNTALRNALRRSDQLLSNVVPDKVLRSFVERGITTLAENYEHVTILFVDVVNFTSVTAQIPPLDVVVFLSSLFSLLESITSQHNLTKIKTIGDAFMAAAGVPEPDPAHAVHAARASLHILAEISTITDPKGNPTQVRVGLHSGTCAGGVIGEHRIAFDVWGDTVNMASRMQSTARVNTAQCSESTASLIDQNFSLQFTGLKDVKGKGRVRTFIISSEL